MRKKESHSQYGPPPIVGPHTHSYTRPRPVRVSVWTPRSGSIASPFAGVGMLGVRSEIRSHQSRQGSAAMKAVGLLPRFNIFSL